MRVAAAAPGRPIGTPLHATAIAIGGRGLLIRGASGAGKSALALALIALSTRSHPIELIGDDRVLLRPAVDRAGGFVVRPHPRIAGFIERRGLGLVAIPWRKQAPVAGCITLGPAPPAGEAEALFSEAWLRDLPTLRLAHAGDDAAARVLEWWRLLARPIEHRWRENDAAQPAAQANNSW